jgi:hypothetical protein
MYWKFHNTCHLGFLSFDAFTKRIEKHVSSMLVVIKSMEDLRLPMDVLGFNP